VLGVLLESGIRLTTALDALSEVGPPPGRMQRIAQDGKPLVVVDYAHTPDALEKALIALRLTVAAGGALTVVFGCGGDRDKGKRPEMGRIAATLADRLIVTNDNPRTEDPEEIAASVMRGVRQAPERDASIELDRAQAVRGAIAAAAPGDVVLIAGKGHEKYQIINGRKEDFDDKAVLKEMFELLGK